MDTGSVAIQEMLAKLASDEGMYRTPTEPANDPNAEWEGMPEFEHEDKTSAFRCIVHFETEADKKEFEAMVGQTIPHNTRAIWYPKQERQVVRDKGYVTDEP